jgi:hypothetical protein
MQVLNKAFQPIAGSTVQRTVTTTSARVSIPAVALGATAVRVVFTAGTAAARIRSGKTATAVTLTDMLIPNPGTPFVYSEVFGIDATDTDIAAITDSGTCTVEFTFGFGS